MLDHHYVNTVEFLSPTSYALLREAEFCPLLEDPPETQKRMLEIMTNAWCYATHPESTLPTYDTIKHVRLNGSDVLIDAVMSRLLTCALLCVAELVGGGGYKKTGLNSTLTDRTDPFQCIGDRNFEDAPEWNQAINQSSIEFIKLANVLKPQDIHLSLKISAEWGDNMNHLLDDCAVLLVWGHVFKLNPTKHRWLTPLVRRGVLATAPYEANIYPPLKRGASEVESWTISGDVFAWDFLLHSLEVY